MMHSYSQNSVLQQTSRKPSANKKSVVVKHRLDYKCEWEVPKYLSIPEETKPFDIYQSSEYFDMYPSFGFFKKIK